MTQVTTEDIERFMDVMGKNASTMEAWARAADARRKIEEEDNKSKKTERDRRQEFNNKLDEANQSLRGFTRGADEAIGTLAKMMLAPLGKSAFIGIAAFTALWSAGSKLNDTWREMTDIGQTFHGSMFQMAKAAASAGMPLDTFAKLQKNYNVLINASGTKFWQVNKQLSDNIIKHGMYGMSLDQLGEMTGTYMEVSRKNGSLQSRSSGQLVRDMDDLADMTTALAGASDKTRQEIANLAKEAMTSAHAIAGMRMLPQEIRGSVQKSFEQATTILSSMMGDAGSVASKALGDAMGINSELTEMGSLFNDAGLSDVVSQINQTAQNIKNGTMSSEDAAFTMSNKMIDAVQANIETLNVLAVTNPAAKRLVETFGTLEHMNRAQYEQKKKEARATESFTALMASIGVIWTKIKTSFTAAFGGAFEKAFKGFHNFAESPLIQKLIDFAGNLGARLGKLLGETLTATNIDRLTMGIDNVIQGFLGVADTVVKLSPLWDVLSGALGVLGSITTWVADKIAKMGDEGGRFVGKVIGFGVLLFGAMKMIGGIRSLFGKMLGRDMTINARTVNVNGGEGFGGGGGGGGRGGKGGRFGRLMNLGRRGLRTGGFRGMLRGASRGLGAMGGLGGLARGGIGGLAKGAMRNLPLLGVGLEGLDYLTGSKAINWRNLAKSGLSLGGGALGAIGGGIATGGLGGEFIGGAAGYAGGKALGDWLLPDKPAAPATSAGTKAAAATAAATASIAATNAAMMQQQNLDGTTPAATDPQQTLIDEIKALRAAVQRGDGAMMGKMDQMNRLLGKIEVSAQSL